MYHWQQLRLVNLIKVRSWSKPIWTFLTTLFSGGSVLLLLLFCLFVIFIFLNVTEEFLFFSTLLYLLCLFYLVLCKAI